MSYKLTKDQLFFDLYAAFLCAKKHKSNKDYVKDFEENLYDNLSEVSLLDRNPELPLVGYCNVDYEINRNQF